MTQKSGSTAKAPKPPAPKAAGSRPAPKVVQDPVPSKDFPIVGVGASAGGLEALEQLVAHLPPKPGMALVVVQHLDPTHRGILVELLQRVTPLPVVQITDRMPVEKNHVYVIPPNRDLALLHGVLHIQEPTTPRGLRLPIDGFFRTLAEDQRERSIAVILSGMGSDGTAGARAIKEQGGAVFVQAQPKFDGMPRSATEAGLADVTLPAEELGAKLCAYIRYRPVLPTQPGLAFGDQDQSNLEKIILLLRSRTGHDFTFYKKSTLYRRVERRIALHQLNRIADYVRYLRENLHEADLLFRELLIGVTAFFRDPEVWQQLKAEVMPALFAAHPNGANFRAWCPGCSTGEEAYSLAIIFQEALAQANPSVRYTLQVFATDLDKEAIHRARVGTYSRNIAENVPAARLRKYFQVEDRGYKVAKETREMVIFAPQNLVMDPPFTKLDLLFCRNLLIYLEGALQNRLLPLFHYSLNPGGFLVLGTSESVGAAADHFTALPGKNRIFQCRESGLRSDQVEFPSSFTHKKTTSHQDSTLIEPTLIASSAPNLQALTEGILLQHFAPAAVLTTSKGDIVYISGKTGNYLEPAAGKANLNVFAMAREGLGGALNEAFSKALRQQVKVTLNRVTVGTNSGSRCVDVTVQALAEPLALRGMVLIVFSDLVMPDAHPKASTSKASLDAGRLSTLGLELQQARDEVQTVREEMQSSQEELKSTNEELQSTNEELQSTNEELTTSKEEMQSMNEELQTVNLELQAKVDELSKSKDDMLNLLNSTNIATLFLDDELRVRRFTPQTVDIIKLIPGDAGRPITDLVTELDYPDLADDARRVLRLLVPQELVVRGRNDRWFTVRIMPYRTQANRIDGLVITFVDISAAKRVEASLREALTLLQSRVKDMALDAPNTSEVESTLLRAQASLKEQLLHDAMGQPPSTGSSKQGQGRKR